MGRLLKKLTIGDVFGKLTVISAIERRPTETRKPARTLFECECGKLCIKNNADVRQGKTTSCGKCEICTCVKSNTNEA